MTVIDTPGHAAFEAMRLRGAKAADVAILVVAVDDGVQEQTLQAIKYIKQAEIAMVVCITKVRLKSFVSANKIHFTNGLANPVD